MDTRAKKILILHASAGHGHFKAAQAIRSALTIHYPEAQVELFDALDFFPGWVKKIYVDSYIYMITQAKFLWKLSYYSTDNAFWYPVTALQRRIFNGYFGAKLAEKIAAEKPDVIVSTHFMPPEICGALQRGGKLSSKTLTVITDYLVHRFWVINETDQYCVACDETRTYLAGRGIDVNKILVTGFPVDDKFYAVHDKQKIRQQLNIPANKYTVLFTSGGMGAGRADTLIASICRQSTDIQVVVVCGSNKAFKSDMDLLAKTHPNLIPLAFVNNMDEWMSAADVIVGKAGGSTVSEALVKRLPMFLMDPVPGQEAYNVEVLTRNGVAFHVKDKEHLPQMIADFRASADVQAKMRKAMDGFVKPQAAKTICDTIMKL